MFFEASPVAQFFWQRLQGTTFVDIARLFVENFDISEIKAQLKQILAYKSKQFK